ncbi:MAG: MBL fold metallo-hydrolase [Oscillospiraceae bacterium]|nr:MBL fold metallo-hydrolase [Oscillospiraceae bacterium]
MIKNLKMTVLIDNVAVEPLVGEWGLSILIEADGLKILLDAGESGQFVRNAATLQTDLAQVDVGVLSHAHYDHADGMEAFFACNDRAKFLLREGCRENCFGIKDGELHYNGIRKGMLSRFADRIRFVSGAFPLAEGIWLLPHRAADYSPIARRNDLYVKEDGCCRPDDFSHEQSLVVETEKGLVIFNSCSHTGVKNCLDDVREMLGDHSVYAYVGGLHLFKLTDGELSAFAEELRAGGVSQILTGHCTGEHAIAFLRQLLGDRVRQLSAGFTCVF